MCDKLGEKTETHFEGCRVGELDGFGETKRKGERGRKGRDVRIKERKLGNEMEKVWGRNEQNLSVKWKEVKGQILRNWGRNGRSLRVKSDGFNRTVLEVCRQYWGVTQCIPHIDEYAAVCWWTCRSTLMNMQKWAAWVGETEGRTALSALNTYCTRAMSKATAA